MPFIWVAVQVSLRVTCETSLPSPINWASGAICLTHHTWWPSRMVPEKGRYKCEPLVWGLGFCTSRSPEQEFSWKQALHPVSLSALWLPSRSRAQILPRPSDCLGWGWGSLPRRRAPRPPDAARENGLFAHIKSLWGVSRPWPTGRNVLTQLLETPGIWLLPFAFQEPCSHQSAWCGGNVWKRYRKQSLCLQPKPAALGQRGEETLMHVEASCSLLHTTKKAVFLLKKKTHFFLRFFF